MSVVRVLLVEDDVPAQALISREIETIATDGLVLASSLAEGFAAVATQRPDCVVLDLSLPDGWGLDTLLQFRRRVREVPIVVVSGSQGEQFEAKARRSGATSFVQKGSMHTGDVAEAVVEAVRRARAGDLASDPVEEIVAIGARRSPVTAGLFGQVELPDSVPGHFDELVAKYSDLLELALERTAFATESALSDHLRDLAHALGVLRAGPRDVVRIHADALELQAAQRQGAGAPAFMHEARLVALELMGYLVSYYRLQALGRDSTGGESD